MRERLRRLRAFHLRALFSIVILALLTWQALVPADRRKRHIQVHWLGGDRRKKTRRLRPVDLVVPVIIVEVGLLAYVTQLSPAEAMTKFAMGSLVVAGVAMIPSACNLKVAHSPKRTQRTGD